MHLKFDGTLSGFAVKQSKDAGKVVIIAFTTELTNSIASLAMMYGSTVTVELDHFAWETGVTITKVGQATIEQALSEECAACGHQKGFHKLDPNVCLGDDGMCPCSGFVSREQAAKEAEGDTAEVVDDLPPLPDELHCSCGHLRSDHDKEQGCMFNYATRMREEDLDDHTCKCVRVFLEDGTPDGLVGDHDGEEPLPLPNTLCVICGHELQFHDDELGCCVKVEDGYPVATCDCPGFAVSVDDGAPGYDYDLPDEAEIATAEAAVIAEETAGDICPGCGHLKISHSAVFGCMGEGSNGRTCECFQEFSSMEKYPVEGDGNALAGPEEKPKRRRKRKAEETDHAQVA